MTVDERLREAHARIPDPDPAVVAAARARLTAAMGEEAPARRRRPLRLALPAFALAVAAAAAIALLPRGDAEVAGPARPDAAAVLAAGDIYYQRNRFHVGTRYFGADARPTREPGDAAFAVARDVPEDVWIAPDGSARVEYGAAGAAYLPTADDERAWRAAGSPDLERLMGRAVAWGPERQEFPRGSFLREWLYNASLERVLPARDPLSALPREPAALAAFLAEAVRKQRPDGDEEDRRQTLVGDLATFLRHQFTPPALRAALVEVAVTTPGVRPLGEITDAAGRRARAFAYSGGLVLALDLDENRLLAEGLQARGGIDWSYTYALTTAGVARIGDRP